jgi:uncharacterized protein (DUF1810 family)
MADPYHLERFVDAQDSGSTYEVALAELRDGRKTSHWMWFVFPQIAGLGHSGMAQKYAINSLAEARAYLQHPVLGPRLVECAEALLAVDGRSADAVLGSIDAMKLRSSMTLFARAAPQENVVRQVLNKYFQATEDPATIAELKVDGRGI